MPGDYRSLVNAVERFILLSRSDREKMGKAGRKKVEKEFDRNIVVNRYMLELDRINEK
jgi:galacturonosyltransferase